jgi:hypothetical protein
MLRQDHEFPTGLSEDDVSSAVRPALVEYQVPGRLGRRICLGIEHAPALVPASGQHAPCPPDERLPPAESFPERVSRQQTARWSARSAAWSGGSPPGPRVELFPGRANQISFPFLRSGNGGPKKSAPALSLGAVAARVRDERQTEALSKYANPWCCSLAFRIPLIGSRPFHTVPGRRFAATRGITRLVNTEERAWQRSSR